MTQERDKKSFKVFSSLLPRGAYLLLLWMLVVQSSLLNNNNKTAMAKKIPNPFSTSTKFGISRRRSSSSRSTNNIKGLLLPEVPSTLLKIHQIYTTHPPHDNTLYRTLRVSPNATSIEIQKSYRKLSRLYHPDKQNQNDDDDDDGQELLMFERIQKAYEILKDDSTRLLYHKYGLQQDGITNAVLILTGYENSPKIPKTKEEMELLSWMGFHNHRFNNNDHCYPPPPPRLVEQQQQSSSSLPSDNNDDDDDGGEEQRRRLFEERIQFLAATIVERIRPLVEGRLTERDVANLIASDCDRLKKLPLGANIIRCIGRAYRHSGQRYLAQQQQQQQQAQAQAQVAAAKKQPQQPDSLYCQYKGDKQTSSLLRRLLSFPHSSSIRDSWHDAKHVATALVASGRVTLKENWLLQQKKKKKKDEVAARRRRKMEQEEKKKKKNSSGNNNKNKPTIAYHNDWEEEGMGGLLFLDDDDNDDDELYGGGGSSSSDDAEDDDGDVADGGDDDDDDVPFLITTTQEEEEEEEMQQQQEIMFKSEKVIVESMQIEALWKVHKILLHRAVRKACDLILSGQYFFYPSHQQSSSSSSPLPPPYDDGWVSFSSSSGGRRSSSSSSSPVVVINANEGRMKAASALVLIGNIMVQSSKEGTAWME